MLTLDKTVTRMNNSQIASLHQTGRSLEQDGCSVFLIVVSQQSVFWQSQHWEVSSMLDLWLC